MSSGRSVIGLILIVLVGLVYVIIAGTFGTKQVAANITCHKVTQRELALLTGIRETSLTKEELARRERIKQEETAIHYRDQPRHSIADETNSHN